MLPDGILKVLFRNEIIALATGTTCGGGPCSLSLLTADATSAILLTGSDLRDLGGADLWSYLVARRVSI